MSHWKRRIPGFLIFKSSKWRLLNETQTFPVSAIIAKSQATGKDCYKFRYFECFRSSNQPFSCPFNSQLQGFEELQGLFPVLPLSWLGEIFFVIEDESLPVLTNNKGIVSGFHLITIMRLLLWLKYLMNFFYSWSRDFRVDWKKPPLTDRIFSLLWLRYF